MKTTWQTIACVLLAFAGLLLFSTGTQAQERPKVAKTFSNPILPTGADPAILEHEGVYYFYSTNSGVHVYSSPDLVKWTKGPSVLPEKFKGAWAPEVYYHPEDGKFYMYYTDRYKIGVAVSDRPDAMFTDLGYLALSGIDAHVFRDDDARIYLYFTHTPSFTMYCVPLKDPATPGGPVTKCFEISAEWEKRAFPINEGPWMLKHDGTYYMLYSGADGQSIYYSVGYATAPTPIGPFTKYEKNPFFQDLPAINGPGHGSVIKDRAGQLWHLYHQKTGVEKGWKRDLCLDPISFDDKGVIHGKPTRGVEQPAPNVDPNLVWVPEFTPRGAFFTESTEVKIVSRTAGVTIRYTLDGTEPTTESPVYDKPIPLKATTVVNARAWKDGMETSRVAKARFTQQTGALAPNPSPDAPAGEAPFTIFPKPNPNWVKPTQ